jgi:hypothetical protein
MSWAQPNHVEDEAVIQYLLGSATEEQTELLDRLSVADEDFAARLKAVEDDLVDAYVRGELAGEMLERFRTYYLASPLRREKVKFAETLLPLSDKRLPVPVLRAPVVFLRPVLAAAACLLLAAGAYWTYEHSRPAQPSQRDYAVAGPPAVPAAPVPQEPLPAPPAGATPLANILFVLAPPTRSGAKLPVLPLPPGTGSVAFRLELEVNDSPFYRAALKDLAGDKVVWRSDELTTEVIKGIPSVFLTVPAALLKTRTYSLDLTGIGASGAAEAIGSYAFRAVRK